MDKFKLETSFQFPFFKINELVSYSEVKKPSGIEYMLLVLISESKDRRALLSQTISNFGVPSSLHFIYSDALDNLIREGILTYNGGYYSREDFKYVTIGSFNFTPKGKKVFAEESIPTGKTKEAKIPVYYDIALNKLMLSIDNSLEPKPLMDSAITPEFMERFSCKKNTEDFMNLNKGKRIPIYENGKVAKNEIIKTEEIITKVEDLTLENWTAKYDCLITLNGNDIKFEYEDKALQKFFDENYTSEMINKFIGFKNKYQFKSSHKDGLKMNDFSSLEIKSIIMPKAIDDVLKQRAQLLITKGGYTSSSAFSIEEVDGLNFFNDACEFVVVDQADNIYAYIPGSFYFTSDTFGTIKIPLVLKAKIKQEELQSILTPYIDKLREYSEDNFSELVKITSISKDYKKAYEVMNSYFANDYESNIVRLNEMKQTATLNANISSKYKEILKENYSNYIKSVNEDNLDTVLKITKGTPKFLNIDNKTVVEDVFKFLGNISSRKNVYEAMVKNGFDAGLISMYANPVVEALRDRTADEKHLADLLNFDSNLNSMKFLTNINDFNNYSFDEEDIDRRQFKTYFTTAKSLTKGIELFRQSNVDLFKSYNGFMSLFGRINDDFNMLDAALSNPKNIKKEIILKKIDAGDYQFAFVNLSAKLELLLKDKFSLDGKLSDMLSEARKTGAIERAVATDLHDFRENRNAYIHPEDRTASFKVDDLRRWCKEIFDLEEDAK